MLHRLEIFDININNHSFDFRPWTFSERLQDPDYPINDAYYIGVRIRGAKIIKSHVDLAETRRLFYEKLAEQMLNNQTIQDLFYSADRPIDLRISYKSRA